MSPLDSELDGQLAEGTRINGTLEFEKAVRIDGRFEGVVKSKGKLILGPSAEVDAEVDVGQLEVEGSLKGKVKAKTRMLIRKGGNVEGDIVAGKLAIESGAVFRGRCEMPKADSQPKPVPASPPEKSSLAAAKGGPAPAGPAAVKPGGESQGRAS